MGPGSDFKRVFFSIFLERSHFAMNDNILHVLKQNWSNTQDILVQYIVVFIIHIIKPAQTVGQSLYIIGRIAQEVIFLRISVRNKSTIPRSDIWYSAV